MRYANIGNYIRAGGLGAAGALGALAATQASSPNFADQQRIAMNLQGQRQALIQDLENPDEAYLSKVSAARNAASAAKLSYERKEIEQAKFEKRKAGKIALAAQLAKKPVLEPEPYDTKPAYDAIGEQIRTGNEAIATLIKEGSAADAAERQAILEKYKFSTPNTTNLQPISSNPDSPNLKFIKDQLQSFPGVASQLVSSEALRNTDDEYGVIANALLRVKSPQFANDLHSVAFDRGADGNTIQYAGIWTPNAIVDEKLIKKLTSPEGIANIDRAMTQLGDRLFFKSSMDPSTGKNYKPDIDIMFAPQGNYYHGYP